MTRRLGLNALDEAATQPSVRLLDVSGGERDVVTALLFESTDASETALRDELSGLTDNEVSELLRELVGERANRRHRPGRGFEAARYRFEIVSDYGAFRDLQRHRMLTIQWQALSPDLGAEVPEEARGHGPRG